MKLTIRSHKMRFDSDAHDETEQVIRYTTDGRLYFRGYVKNHVLARKDYVRLKDEDQALLNAIIQKLIKDYELMMFAPDGDRWEMTIEDDNYEVYSYYGSMTGYNKYGIDLTQLLQCLTQIDHLYAFGD